MDKVNFIEHQLLKTKYLTTCSVVDALEDDRFFNLLVSYSQLDLNTKRGFNQLITDAYVDDLTFSLLMELSDEDRKKLLDCLKKPHTE